VYRKAELAPSPSSEFELPCGGRLSADNRWVKMAQLIPWSEFESEYAQNFPTEKGAPAKSFRMALGALIIKEKLLISDRLTVERVHLTFADTSSRKLTIEISTAKRKDRGNTLDIPLRSR
jgi:IS5 family transposase